MIESVLGDFGLNSENINICPLQQGLINSTWKVTGNGHVYIFQKLNDQVFKNPGDIDDNIRAVALYLQEQAPGYLFIAPVQSVKGETLVYRENDGYYRVFPFVPGSGTIEVVESPAQSYEAAKQFGMFTRNLAGFDCSRLKTTLPSFHDLSLRYSQFLEAIASAGEKRTRSADALTRELKNWSFIVEEFENIKWNPGFKTRVTHHDTKISNVLFDKQGRGICVIDLDTVMPGYFFSDVGDMMRTYLSPVSEEETDFSKIELREEFFRAIVRGYYSEMKDELTETEKQYFFYSGAFMIYMQALRFLADYLGNDKYYGARYPEHNLIRAGNQAALLKKLYGKKELLENIVLAEIAE